MPSFGKIIKWLSNLKVAIGLLVVIAIASALGTAIPQGEANEAYLSKYGTDPWLGLFNGEALLFMQFDHIYSSYWFLTLLLWLGLALILCSWRRQFPMLKAALRWIDYKSPQQINKLVLAQTIEVSDTKHSLEKITSYFQSIGWKINQKADRFAARKGVIGRVGPPLVHLGLILLMIGSVVGVLKGQKVESFLLPGRSIEVLDPKGNNQLSLKLNNFSIKRDPLGRPEQFTSKIEIDQANQNKLFKEISVNHPLRFRGITIYQADWNLASLKIQLNDGPILQLPLRNFKELGDQIWGVVIPTSENNENPVLISISNEQGPIKVFNESGINIATLFPGQESKNINNISMRVIDVTASSGILIKRDPGVPLVYSGFLITLLGGFLSIICTRQIWVIKDQNLIHIGGLCNRNLAGFANELPKLLKTALNE